MKKFLLSAAFCAATFAGFAEQVVVNVETAGTLSTLVSADDKYTITDLKVSGDLNGADVLFIREMTGSNKKNQDTKGVLAVLDLSGANILKDDKNFYLDYLDTNYYVQIQMPTEKNCITYEMFGPKLTKIVLPASAEAIDPQAFTKCTALAEVEIKNNAIYKTVDNVLMDLDETGIAFYPPGKTAESYTVPATVTDILDCAFQNNKYLKELKLNDGLKTIGSTAFYNCANITSLDIPSSVTKLGESAFYSCKSATSITFPASLETIPAYVCCYCTSLETINWPEDVKVIDEFAFYGIGATTVDIPEGVTEIRTWAFERTEKLTKVNFPTTLTKLGDAVFALSNVEHVRLPEGLTQMDEMCFSKCLNLKSISFPSTLSKLDNQVIAYAAALEDIWSYSEVPPTSSIKMSGADLYATAFYCMLDKSYKNIDFDKVVVHVPVGTTEAYKKAQGWDMFKNFVEFDLGGTDIIAADNNATPVDYYDINGRRIDSTVKGLNIIRMSDGSVRKVFVR